MITDKLEEDYMETPLATEPNEDFSARYTKLLRSKTKNFKRTTTIKVNTLLWNQFKS